MVGLSIGCGSLVGESQSSSVGCNEMRLFSSVYNCIICAPRYRGERPRARSGLEAGSCSPTVALFCGVVE